MFLLLFLAPRYPLLALPQENPTVGSKLCPVTLLLEICSKTFYFKSMFGSEAISKVMHTQQPCKQAKIARLTKGVFFAPRFSFPFLFFIIFVKKMT